MTSTLPARRQGTLPATTGPLPFTAEALTPGLTSRDVGSILFRHKAKVLGFCFATLLTTAALITLRPKTYTSEALLLVRHGRDSVALDPTATTGRVLPMNREWRNSLNSELAMLNSFALADSVVETLDLDAQAVAPSSGRKKPGSMALLRARAFLSTLFAGAPGEGAEAPRLAAVKRLRRSLDIVLLPESDMIRVRCKLPGTQTAWEAITALITGYEQMHAVAHRTGGSLEFFSKQTADLKRELQSAEQALSDRKNRMGTASPAALMEDASRRLSSLRDQHNRVQLEIASADARRDALQATLTHLSKAPSTLLPESVRQMRAELQTLETDLHALTRRQKTLRAQHQAALQAVRTLNEQQGDFRTIEREIAILEQKYLKYSTHMEEARIGSALELEPIPNISLVQPPTDPDQPDDTNSALMMLAAMILSGAGAVGIALVADRMDQTVRSPSDLEDRLHIRVLASVPVMEKRHVQPKRYRHHGKGIDPRELRPKPQKAAAPFFLLAGRALSVISGPPSPQPVLVGITGCARGGGTSTVATNLSIALAGLMGRGERVLMIQPDAAHSSSASFQREGGGPRATGYALNENGRTAVTERNIYELQEEGEPEVPHHVSCEDLIIRARQCDATVVVFDLSPLSDALSTECLAPMMDYTLLVVESERTHWHSLQHLHRNLLDRNVELMGAVLNKRRYYVPTWLYERL